jgi:electron transport complex protein RnfA
MNLILQCGIGIKGAAEAKNPINASTFVKSLIIFFAVILLWLFFAKIVISISSGIFIYVLLFPVTSIVYNGLEFLIFRYLLEKDPKEEGIICFPCGITAIALFYCINIADDFLQAVVISFGFTLGIFLVNLIIREIRKRAALEAVPVFMRGKPLVLVSMGLLSLIFSTASLLLFRVIGFR